MAFYLFLVVLAAGITFLVWQVHEGKIKLPDFKKPVVTPPVTTPPVVKQPDNPPAPIPTVTPPIIVDPPPVIPVLHPMEPPYIPPVQRVVDPAVYAPTQRPTSVTGYLDAPGGLPVAIPSKSSKFIVRGQDKTQLVVEIGNTFHPFAVTVYKPDGAVALKWRRYDAGQPVGPEQPAMMRGPEASLLVDTHTPGDYSVEVLINDSPDNPALWEPGLSRINHWRNDL
jgi:hypothetical protein